MLLSQIEFVMVLVMAGIILIFVIVTAGKVLTPWLQAFMAGVPISVFQIVGMRLRKVDVRVVVRSLIMATQAGSPVPSVEMEGAYLLGVDLEKLTLDLIHADREGKKSRSKSLWMQIWKADCTRMVNLISEVAPQSRSRTEDSSDAAGARTATSVSSAVKSSGAGCRPSGRARR